MARLLYQQDSTPLHKRMARRHIRLCLQIQGATQYVHSMQECLNLLIIKEAERNEAEEMCENALDDLTLKDTAMDNQVRNLFEHSRRYDRDHLTQYTSILFPHNNFTEIISLPAAEQLLKIAQLIEKIESFDETHELRQYIKSLTDAVNEVNLAINERRQAAETLNRRQASEELARIEVRSQYEFNYLDARKNFGKQKAEMLFPKISHKPKKMANNTNENVTAE